MMNRIAIAPKAKFQDPDWTLDGVRRACVPLRRLEMLWFNTGTLCNLECAHCYIESSPRNDRLVYLSAAEVDAYLDEIAALDLGTTQIGLTGGEPFMNPEIDAIMAACLERGFELLVLTNAMTPMKHHRAALLELHARYGDRLTLRVSVDHYTQAVHESERGPGSWAPMIEGITWLAESGMHWQIAGRMFTGESDAEIRAGYTGVLTQLACPLDTDDPAALLLFPEMDETADVPEITVDCWDTLGVRPDDMMCASARMVVKRKGTAAPVVVPCTLLPYDVSFELGETLAEAQAPVKLNHPHCAKFCVLGGGSCTVVGSSS